MTPEEMARLRALAEQAIDFRSNEYIAAAPEYRALAALFEIVKELAP